jgi:hypothetical protein
MGDWSDEPDDDTDEAYQRLLNTGMDQAVKFLTLAKWCERVGVLVPPKFREYDPTDEDRRMLAELGIEA